MARGYQCTQTNTSNRARKREEKGGKKKKWGSREPLDHRKGRWQRETKNNSGRDGRKDESQNDSEHGVLNPQIDTGAERSTRGKSNSARTDKEASRAVEGNQSIKSINRKEPNHR